MAKGPKCGVSRRHRGVLQRHRVWTPRLSLAFEEMLVCAGAIFPKGRFSSRCRPDLILDVPF